MRVLVACELSGVVRDAFLRRGHEAMSCDLLPSETPGPHYQGDALDILNDGWDLMIAHPPCTHLAVSGARYFKFKFVQQAQALDFVRALLNAPIPRICLENPVSIISTRIRKPEQIIQPWMFGHDASKTTCLWLKDLPRLIWNEKAIVPPRGWITGWHTNKHTAQWSDINGVPFTVPKGAPLMPRWGNQTQSGQNKLGPSATRAKERSRTYQGIANAMAEQWS